jgi:hypothetical protein
MQRSCFVCCQLENYEMKNLLLPILLFLFISLSSCYKDDITTGVLMRIENTTSQNFTEVLSNDESFGSVDASFTTSYKSFEKIVDVPKATLIIGTDTLYAGLYYFDYPSYFNNGKYTLQVYTDTLSYSGYGCRYIKD